MALRCYKFLLYKRYFDTGYGILGYVKLLVALIGVSAAIQDVPLIYIGLMGVLFGISCFIVGWSWYHFRLIDTENEITNQFNPFATQVRKKFGLPKNIKSIKI